MTKIKKKSIIILMISSLDKHRIIEHQKERLKKRILFHKKNVILQSVVSFLFIAGGLQAAQKKSILVPLIAAPSAATALSKLAVHETKRKRYKEILNELEKE